MPGGDWIPAWEQDLVDLCLKWKQELEKAANSAAYGREQTEVTAALGKINAFLTARTG